MSRRCSGWIKWGSANEANAPPMQWVKWDAGRTAASPTTRLTMASGLGGRRGLGRWRRGEVPFLSFCYDASKCLLSVHRHVWVHLSLSLEWHSKVSMKFHQYNSFRYCHNYWFGLTSHLCCIYPTKRPAVHKHQEQEYRPRATRLKNIQAQRIVTPYLLPYG